MCETMTVYEGFCWGLLGLALVPLSSFVVGSGLLGSFGVREGERFFVFYGILWGRVCCGFGSWSLAPSVVSGF